MTRKEETKCASKDYINYLLDKQEYHNENYTEYDIQQAFEKGAEWADNNPKSHWISVEDDLPCNHEELITADGRYEKNTICVITINKHGIIESNHMVLYDNGKWEWRYDVPAPCYWMLIPKLPKESEIDLTVY